MVKYQHPELVPELKLVLNELINFGTVPDTYQPHLLTKAGGNYNGYVDFHLSEGKVDVLVLYLPHKSNPSIRLVRIGSHDELFQGPLK
ncbi:type II toxin-antitoxin system YafQ family toxin [Lactiplantibacillus sp. WILCCON 0030]|uniref:Type II toxin-antitoxin system YafQ family toxin n=1 Tax=Lactiplantibacillus brownii TaxID=3069269 RepID=A0ABU1AB71_9LACO|nr:type II toxin-antitoxin system YafQ family toxin [Lactiplantibacillus brownii]MDQ7938143.1 type II toxin-antitoxin system YafQ family toxin [Lactiplantibacillus brownii]